jgi:glycosyltransferase involved in cell wall biosynthesis
VPGEVWTVLFHGNLRPDRNVHGVIDSVPLWREFLRLVIRGNGPAAYVSSLHEQVARAGLADRVTIEPAVPFGDVIAAARTADIGVIPWSLDLPQKRFALPNKLFEYLAAGLCVVQTGPSESADLVDALGAGVRYPQATPEALAGALNALTREQLVTHKEAAHRGMSALTWESEQEKLWALYTDS